MLRLGSRILLIRLSLAGTACCAAGMTAFAAISPAAANSFIAHVEGVVTCSTTAACVAGTNTGNGDGVAGTSARWAGVSGTSATGDGVVASSTAGRGVYATSAKSNAISGISSYTYGVVGITGGSAPFPANNAAGVWGYGQSIGVLGSTSSNGYGVYGMKALTTSGTGILGKASADGVGTRGESNSGYGVYARSVAGTALGAYSAQGIGLRSDIAGTGFSVVGTSLNGAGAGADFEGGRYGIVGRAQPSGFPLVLTDSSYHNVFYVSGTGDIYYSGNFYSFARTNAGAAVSSFTAKSTQPTVEDTGSARLSGGVVTVALDRAFGAAVDTSTPYRVFITPDGDTHGLFVAQKTSRGFVVRETEGGRSNVAFDYRIVATSRGGAGRRMSLTSLAAVPSAPQAPLRAEPASSGHSAR